MATPNVSASTFRQDRFQQMHEHQTATVHHREDGDFIFMPLDKFRALRDRLTILELKASRGNEKVIPSAAVDEQLIKIQER